MKENRAEIFIDNRLEKTEVVDLVDEWRYELELLVEEINTEKPWGAYWKFPDWQVGQFIDLFFPEMNKDSIDGMGSLSPKLLLVAPGARLSWQYHNRRAEKWAVVCGPVGVMTSERDSENGEEVLRAGEKICLENGLRHRLSGRDGWGLVAEIWVHTDATNPSDEEDVVRVRDDYGRS
jgi:mannose-6-phosphate isomerase